VNRRLIVAVALATMLSVLVVACGGDGGESTSSGTKPRATQAPTTQASVTAGRDVFVANCAACHGQNAEGGLGPRLAGGAVVQKYPSAADQVAFVEGHPFLRFGDRLTPEQIRDVVEYTRSAK
jgi:mono/diheme cytochrome c family protein